MTWCPNTKSLVSMEDGQSEGLESSHKSIPFLQDKAYTEFPSCISVLNVIMI